METKHKTHEDDIQKFIEPILKRKGDENNIIDLDAYALGLIDAYKELYASDENRKKYEPKQSDVEQDARIFCEHLDEELGEAWSNDYDELPKRMAEFALKWQSQQPVSIQWLSDEEINQKYPSKKWPDDFNTGKRIAAKEIQTELRKRVNAVDPVEFLRYVTEETNFKPTGSVNEFKALHMSDGWVYRTSEQLLEDYIEHLTSKTKQHE